MKRFLLKSFFVFLSLSGVYAQQNTGTLVGAPIRPNDARDPIPSAFANEILGGHHQFATIGQRDSIMSERRVEGMLCTVLDDGNGNPKTYQLLGGTANTNWVAFIGAGSGSLFYSTGLNQFGDTIIAHFDTAIWNANAIVGKPVSNTNPLDNQILQYDSSLSEWQYVDPQKYYPGTGLLLINDTFYALDTSAIWNASNIQNNPVSTSHPNPNEILKWNGAQWAPAVDENTTYIAGTGIFISGNFISAMNTFALWNANKLQGYDISPLPPSVSGQVLKWNGSQWIPGTDENTTYTAGTGINISGTSISALNSNNLWNANQLQGADITSTPPSTDGQILTWNSTSSQWEPISPVVYKAGTGLNLNNDTFSAQVENPIWNANKILSMDLDTSNRQTGTFITWNGNQLIFDSTSMYDSFNGNRAVKRSGWTGVSNTNMGTTTNLRDFIEEVFFPFIPATISISGNVLYEIGTANNVTVSGSTTQNDETTFSNGVVVRIYPDTANIYSFGSSTTYSTSVMFSPKYDSASTQELRFIAKQDVGNNGNPTTISSNIKYLRSTYPLLHGVNTDATLINGGTAIYTALTKMIELKSNKNISLTGTNGYIYFAYPSSYGNLTSILDHNNFEQITAFTKYTANVSSSALTNDWLNISFNIYRSNVRTSPTGWTYQFKF
jgi:hypothetical protein